jgi:hypothetical protein
MIAKKQMKKICVGDSVHVHIDWGRVVLTTEGSSDQITLELPAFDALTSYVEDFRRPIEQCGPSANYEITYSRSPDGSQFDGWIAWKGNGEIIMPMTISKQWCVKKLLERYYGVKDYQSFGKAEEYFAASESMLCKAEADGWRVRPVKLVFLDEEK